MNYTQIHGTLKMTDAFFISEQLQGIVSKESLIGNSTVSPVVLISNCNYKVDKIEINQSGYTVSVLLQVDKDFKISENITVDCGDMFGMKLNNAVFDFKGLYFCNKQKKYFCEIIIDKEKFWS